MCPRPITNGMDKQRQVQAVIGLVVIVALLFGVSYYLSQNREELKIGESQLGEVDGDVQVDVPRATITAKHQYRNGTHIIAGEIEVPTPCHILETDVIIRESFPEQVTVRFTVSTQAEICAQVITPARFKVEFEASERASILGTLNGEPVIFNLIEAGSDENLDEFELFIKG